MGGNTGETNSFVGVNPSDLTGGVYNADNLLEGNNLFCFAVQAALQGAPDILSGLFNTIDDALDVLGSAVSDATDGLGCPELGEINREQFEQYPGYAELDADGEY